MEDSVRVKRVRDEAGETELDADFPEVKRLREDLLDGLDDDAELWAANQDLDSFMKSFEEEIAASPLAAQAVDCGGSRPDLGYLLEASDDELGLPPTRPAQDEPRFEVERVGSDSSDLGGEFWEIPSCDLFEFGLGDVGSEYVALDGLFDHSDLGFGLVDFARKPETLPAQ